MLPFIVALQKHASPHRETLDFDSHALEPLLGRLVQNPVLGEERAEIALEAMLFCVVRRLPQEKAKALLEELPASLAERLETGLGESDESVDRAYLLDELARRLDIDTAAAEGIAESSAAVLRQRESSADASELARGLLAILTDRGKS